MGKIKEKICVRMWITCGGREGEKKEFVGEGGDTVEDNLNEVVKGFISVKGTNRKGV